MVPHQEQGGPTSVRRLDAAGRAVDCDRWSQRGTWPGTLGMHIIPSNGVRLAWLLSCVSCYGTSAGSTLALFRMKRNPWVPVCWVKPLSLPDAGLLLGGRTRCNAL